MQGIGTTLYTDSLLENLMYCYKATKFVYHVFIALQLIIIALLNIKGSLYVLNATQGIVTSIYT